MGRVGSGPDEEPVSDAQKVTPASPGRLVLVDDEPAILATAKATLEAHGYRVFTAGGGADMTWVGLPARSVALTVLGCG